MGKRPLWVESCRSHGLNLADQFLVIGLLSTPPFSVVIAVAYRVSIDLLWNSARPSRA